MKFTNVIETFALYFDIVFFEPFKPTLNWKCFFLFLDFVSTSLISHMATDSNALVSILCKNWTLDMVSLMNK